MSEKVERWTVLWPGSYNGDTISVVRADLYDALKAENDRLAAALEDGFAVLRILRDSLKDGDDDDTNLCTAFTHYLNAWEGRATRIMLGMPPNPAYGTSYTKPKEANDGDA